MFRLAYFGIMSDYRENLLILEKVHQLEFWQGNGVQLGAVGFMCPVLI